jgi:hypothetical protein
VSEKTLSKSKRLIEKDVESIKTKRRKLFDNNVSTKPSFQSVNKDVDVICIDDEDSSDSETGCQENQNITTQPLPSEVPNQSFENHHEEQVLIVIVYTCFWTELSRSLKLVFTSTHPSQIHLYFYIS